MRWRSVGVIALVLIVATESNAGRGQNGSRCTSLTSAGANSSDLIPASFRMRAGAASARLAGSLPSRATWLCGDFDHDERLSPRLLPLILWRVDVGTKRSPLAEVWAD
jgi:hypothetical protein